MNFIVKIIFCIALIEAAAIIEHNKPVKDKFLIVGGDNRNYVPETVTLDSATFEAEQITAHLNVYSAVGFSTDLGPTICGGVIDNQFDKKCFTLTNGTTWTNSFNLNTSRYVASYIPISASKVLVIGGQDENWNTLNTMEMVNTGSMGSTVEENNLPFKFADGCATIVNETHGLLIGGRQDERISSKTYFINLLTLETYLGPELKQNRSSFGCATTDNKKVYISGGWDDWLNPLASTEILDLTKPNPSWTSGPDLPTAAQGLSLVESANGVLAIGGRDENWNALKSILRLKCNNGQECQWIKAGEMNHARTYSSVIPYKLVS